MFTSTYIAAYIALFAIIGFLFVFVNLLVGRFLRPKAPNAEKLEIYECGEPTIGSSFIQFDLRFYVVALLFIIFDVEVAFFFPWATVFGKSTHLMDENLPVVQSTEESTGVTLALTPAARDLYRELGVQNPTLPRFELETDGPFAVGTPSANAEKLSEVDQASVAVRNGSRKLALMSLVDIGVFFAVLLVGFAYVWRRGDLDWVRAVSRAREAPPPPTGPTLEERTMAGVA